jgi:hypothetical protein
MTFLEMIKHKKGKVKHQSDKQILQNYCKYHQQSYRKIGSKWVNGAFVENEIIAAVAYHESVTITVASCSAPQLHVASPDGKYMDYFHEEAQGTPFFLWCTQGHYQAIVPLNQIEVLESAICDRSFEESNLLLKQDIRT